MQEVEGKSRNSACASNGRTRRTARFDALHQRRRAMGSSCTPPPNLPIRSLDRLNRKARPSSLASRRRQIARAVLFALAALETLSNEIPGEVPVQLLKLLPLSLKRAFIWQLKRPEDVVCGFEEHGSPFPWPALTCSSRFSTSTYADTSGEPWSVPCRSPGTIQDHQSDASTDERSPEPEPCWLLARPAALSAAPSPCSRWRQSSAWPARSSPIQSPRRSTE
jgi:hypothetical protein